MVTVSISWTLQKRISMANTANITGCQKWLIILMVVGSEQNCWQFLTPECTDFSMV
jgi:hypothetical protein